MFISNRKIGENEPIFVVAELSANHNQDLETALKLVKKSAELGADAVKLQTYTPDTITLNSDKEFFKINHGTIWDSETLYSLYQKTFTPWEWHSEIKDLAESLGLIFFSSPFDKSSVDFLEDLNVPCFKIASPEITDIPLIKYVASKQKPIIISTGLANFDDIDLAIETCLSENNSQIVLLKCSSSYPTSLEEIELKLLNEFKKKYRCLVGISDHSLSNIPAISSIAMGACVVEKHFKLKDTPLTEDSEFSIDEYDFENFIADIRNTEKALRVGNFINTDKMRKLSNFRRSLFIVADVLKDELISPNNVKSIRPGHGLHPKHFQNIIGKKFSRNIKAGTPLKDTDIQNF